MKSHVHLPKELQLHKEPYNIDFYALDFVFVLFQTYLFNNYVVLISTNFPLLLNSVMVCKIGETALQI